MRSYQPRLTDMSQKLILHGVLEKLISAFTQFIIDIIAFLERGIILHLMKCIQHTKIKQQKKLICKIPSLGHLELQMELPFNFQATSQPIYSVKMCPGDFFWRLVNQGSQIANYDQSPVSAGGCPTLENNSPVEFYLYIGDYITEALLRIGEVLDRLTLVVTRNDGDTEHFSVGGPYGGAFDATPDPK